MQEKLDVKKGHLFVQADSMDWCPECTWFVRMYVDPATAEQSDVTITTSQINEKTTMVEVRSAESSGESAKGQLFMPAEKKRPTGQPEPTTFLKLGGSEIDTKGKNKAKVKKRDDQGKVTHEISIG